MFMHLDNLSYRQVAVVLFFALNQLQNQSLMQKVTRNKWLRPGYTEFNSIVTIGRHDTELRTDTISAKLIKVQFR